VECTATIGIAIVGYFLVIGFPDTMLASNKLQGFTQREQRIILDWIDRDRRDPKPDKLTCAKFREHVANWELWVYRLMCVSLASMLFSMIAHCFCRFFTCSAPIYAFAYFIQIILGTIVDNTALVFLLCPLITSTRVGVNVLVEETSATRPIFPVCCGCERC
jgi:hypothetical protein